MPKVIIREYDNSTSGITESNNFAVVVPGWVGTPAAGYDPSTVFDENGCAEFTTQADFVNYVGLVGATKEAINATNAVASDAFVLVADTANTQLAKYQIETSTYINFDTKDVANTVVNTVNVTVNGENTTRNIPETTTTRVTLDYGTVVDAVKLDGTNGIYYVLNSLDEREYIHTLVEDTSNIAGYGKVVLDNKMYVIKPVTELTQILDVYDDTKFAVRYKAKENTISIRVKNMNKLGTDGIKFWHKGNQIAYELLGLGYPVIYKKLHGNYSSTNYTKETHDPNFWECLKDRSMYNFRFITTGGDYSAAANTQIVSVAEFQNSVTLEEADTFGHVTGRGDCTALCDIDEEAEENGSLILDIATMESTLNTVGKLVGALPSSKYAAIFAPRVIYSMSDAEANLFEGGDSARTFPASFNYLSCLAGSLSKYAEWYAAAGYTRGISSRTIAKTTIKFGEIANNTLAPRVMNKYVTKSLNLVLCERGNYYLGGNRTAYQLNRSGLVFSHFLNIRQLCTTIKKQLYSACKQFTFDPNSEILWLDFVNSIKPTLEKMKGDQGINGYLISKVKTNKKGVLLAKIRIVPIEAVEDFDISLSLEDSLSGIVLGADEAIAE